MELFLQYIPLNKFCFWQFPRKLTHSRKSLGVPRGSTKKVIQEKGFPIKNKSAFLARNCNCLKRNKTRRTFYSIQYFEVLSKNWDSVSRKVWRLILWGVYLGLKKGLPNVIIVLVFVYNQFTDYCTMFKH